MIHPAGTTQSNPAHLLELAEGGRVSFAPQHPQTSRTHVFTVHPLLAVDFQVPRKSGLEERLIVGVVDVQALVFVRLEIGGDVDDRLDVLSSCNERTRDHRVVSLAEDAHGAEQVLARRLEAVEEPANLVRGHKRLRELLVVLEVNTPHGETLSVEAAQPEVRKCFRSDSRDTHFW